MSDGNFNKALLPHNSFQSGLRAGESRMRQRALEAFRQWYAAANPDAPADAAEREVNTFHTLLTSGQ